MPTTGPYSYKPYECRRCHKRTEEGTNHWGAIYSRCRVCESEGVYTAVKDCLEAPPEGTTLPPEWTIAKLGDIATFSPGRRLPPEREDPS
jgi:hypothetical protein